MTHEEAKQQEQRIGEFHRLEQLRNEIRSAIKAITEPDEDGPCGQGPFTSNTRESRRVCRMDLWFSATRGGAQEVKLSIAPLHIEAPELGRCMEQMLREKLNHVSELIQKL